MIQNLIISALKYRRISYSPPVYPIAFLFSYSFTELHPCSNTCWEGHRLQRASRKNFMALAGRGDLVATGPPGLSEQDFDFFWISDISVDLTKWEMWEMWKKSSSRKNISCCTEWSEIKEMWDYKPFQMGSIYPSDLHVALRSSQRLTVMQSPTWLGTT